MSYHTLFNLASLYCKTTHVSVEGNMNTGLLSSLTRVQTLVC